jgi:transcription elongation factor B subunit 1
VARGLEGAAERALQDAGAGAGTAPARSPDDWVLLKSDDGFAFMVRRRVAAGAGTLRNMLADGARPPPCLLPTSFPLFPAPGPRTRLKRTHTASHFREAIADTCPVQERGAVVAKVCEYLAHRAAHERAGAGAAAGAREEVPEFTPRIPPEMALELCVPRGWCGCGWVGANGWTGSCWRIIWRRDTCAALGWDDASVWLGRSLPVRCADAKRCGSHLYQCRGPRMRSVTMCRVRVLGDSRVRRCPDELRLCAWRTPCGITHACTHTPRFSTQ